MKVTVSVKKWKTDSLTNSANVQGGKEKCYSETGLEIISQAIIALVWKVSKKVTQKFD